MRKNNQKHSQSQQQSNNNNNNINEFLATTGLEDSRISRQASHQNNLKKSAEMIRNKKKNLVLMPEGQVLNTQQDSPRYNNISNNSIVAANSPVTKKNLHQQRHSMPQLELHNMVLPQISKGKVIFAKRHLAILQSLHGANELRLGGGSQQTTVQKVNTQWRLPRRINRQKYRNVVLRLSKDADEIQSDLKLKKTSLDFLSQQKSISKLLKLQESNKITMQPHATVVDARLIKYSQAVGRVPTYFHRNHLND